MIGNKIIWIVNFDIMIQLLWYLWGNKTKIAYSLLFWDARKMKRILMLRLSKYLFYDAFRLRRDKNKLKLSSCVWYEFVLRQDIKNFLATILQNFIILLCFLVWPDFYYPSLHCFAWLWHGQWCLGRYFVLIIWCFEFLILSFCDIKTWFWSQ